MRLDARGSYEWEVVPRRSVSPWRRLSPPQIFVLSFLLLVLLGTVGLKVLPGLYTGAPLGWLDALFTATSAVCVTGLIVVDTATWFTPLGQAFILLLIQLGGLGMLAFASVIILALGGRLSLHHEALSAPGAEITPQVSVQALTRAVVRFTLLAEALGALLLYLLWIPRLGWRGAAWPAVFHSVSAFCNAGFSTFSDSLVGFQTAPFTLLVISALIVVGGIGFLTLQEIYLNEAARRGGRRYRVSTHSRLALAVTALLLGVGWVLFALFEWNSTLADMPAWARPVNALFLSVTARTAGFNSVDYAQTTTASAFLTILLMSVGGSPGSTAGGLKTTTVAIIGLVAWSRLRGSTVTSVGGRSIPEETVQRAVGLFVVAFGLVTAGIFALAVTELGRTPAGEGGSFLAYMFEAASAFNTVGLSMNLTAELSTPGRWIAVALMFLGRVGPLTFAAAIASRAARGSGFRYAYEDVVVG